MTPTPAMEGDAMTQWTLIQLEDAARSRMHLPAVGWPVPAGEVDAVLGPPVRLDRVVEAADRWCDDAPDRAAALAPALARLAYAVAIDEMDDHCWDLAVEHLRIGLRHDPTNVSLRGHLGLALWGAGQRDRAVHHLLVAVDVCRAAGRAAPLLWLLTARALDETGRFAEAASLLEELAALLPAEEQFWDLLAAVRGRAAI
jgi:predicted Zn-dependent protease